VESHFLFAGSDDAARRFAILHTLIVNCDPVGAPPFEYLRDVSRHLANDWPAARLRELLPAAWLADQRRQQQQADRAADPVNDVGGAVVPCDGSVAAAAYRASASAPARRACRGFGRAFAIGRHPLTSPATLRDVDYRVVMP
jgi:hypothetical protein